MEKKLNTFALSLIILLVVGCEKDGIEPDACIGNHEHTELVHFEVEDNPEQRTCQAPMPEEDPLIPEIPEIPEPITPEEPAGPVETYLAMSVVLQKFA